MLAIQNNSSEVYPYTKEQCKDHFQKMTEHEKYILYEIDYQKSLEIQGILAIEWYTQELKNKVEAIHDSSNNDENLVISCWIEQYSKSFRNIWESGVKNKDQIAQLLYG